MTITQVSFKDATSWSESYNIRSQATRANVIELLSDKDYLINKVEWADDKIKNIGIVYGFIVYITWISYSHMKEKFLIYTSIAHEKAWINKLFLTLKSALHNTSKAEEIAVYSDAKMYKLRLKKQ